MTQPSSSFRILEPQVHPRLETLLVEIERVLSDARQNGEVITLSDVSECEMCCKPLDGIIVSSYALIRLRDAKAAYDKAKGMTPSGLHSHAIPEAPGS